MKKVIGDPKAANVIAGGFEGALAPDGSITVELQAITASTSEVGLAHWQQRVLDHNKEGVSPC